jgi:hypothetical protein
MRPLSLLCLLSIGSSPLLHANICVTDYGAKGDGIADDTRALQAALDTGRNITIPEGTYRITNALQPKANQVVELLGTVRVADANIQPLTADAPAGQSSVTVEDA